MEIKKKYVQLIFLTVIVFIVSFLIATWLKSYFKAPRPCVGLPGCPSGYSFPSRHVTVAFALVIAIYLETKDKRIGLILFCLASLIAAYRIATYVHTPADVIAGLILGVLIGWLTQRAYILVRIIYDRTKFNF